MRLCRLNAVAAATILFGLTAPAYADLLINVDKSAQRMTVTVDGVPRYVWPVSTGGPHYDTPSGEFKPNRMDKDHLSQEWDNAPMPYAMFFDNKGHAIHGTYEKSLGRPVSHGCVRLSVANAAKLWDLVKAEGMANTKVVLDGQIPTGGALVAKRGNAGQPLQIDPQQNDGDVTGSLPQDNTYSQDNAYPRDNTYSRNWSNNGDDGYYAQQPRYDNDQRYASRRPYVVRRDYRDDNPPPPFPFFFGR
ncbi:MAG: L,D-transpeptidase [Pseudolabrys sp.]